MEKAGRHGLWHCDRKTSENHPTMTLIVVIKSCSLFVFMVEMVAPASMASDLSENCLVSHAFFELPFAVQDSSPRQALYSFDRFVTVD